MKSNSVSKFILAMIITVVLSLGVDFFAAFVFLKGWGWFVVPVTGFQPLSYWAAFGLMFVIDLLKNCLTWKTNSKDNNNEEIDVISHYIARVVGYAIGAVIGLAISLGIMALVSLGV